MATRNYLQFLRKMQGARSEGGGGGGGTGPGGKMTHSPWGHLLKICLMNFWKGRGRDPSKPQKKLNPAIRQHLERVVWDGAEVRSAFS